MNFKTSHFGDQRRFQPKVINGGLQNQNSAQPQQPAQTLPDWLKMPTQPAAKPAVQRAAQKKTTAAKKPVVRLASSGTGTAKVAKRAKPAAKIDKAKSTVVRKRKVAA